VLANSLPSRADVKELEKLADVYLDTFPFSGSISVIDPLELGIPAVVWEGKTPRSRMASALLRELDVTELFTQDEESYIKLSIKLATEPVYRRKISERIKAAVALKPRFIDSKAYARGLEKVIEGLFEASPPRALATAPAS
jgi:predicted O-linked N-acetylglucosamine transferase (SPINDLY family)